MSLLDELTIWSMHSNSIDNVVFCIPWACFQQLKPEPLYLHIREGKGGSVVFGESLMPKLVNLISKSCGSARA